jgi:hypothetical protein
METIVRSVESQILPLRVQMVVLLVFRKHLFNVSSKYLSFVWGFLETVNCAETGQ